VTPERPDTFEIVRRILGRYVEWERRWGVPVNAFAIKVYEWLFVVVGPTAVVLGVLFVAWGFWGGALITIIGVWMSWLGWMRLIRVVRRLRRSA